MKLNLYTVKDARNCLTKTLDNEVKLIGNLRDSSPVISPVIMVEHIGFVKSNYCYIEEWGRYYWIDEVTSYRNNLWILKLTIDVLMSYNKEIKELSGVVSRLKDGNKYGNRSVLTDCREVSRKLVFEDCPFTRDGSYILIAKGGVKNV